MEAMTLADRLVVLNAGRIEQVGTPIELYEKPATTFVATFIGSPSMNLMALAQGADWTVAPELNMPAQTATLGIRPEDLVVASGSDQPLFRLAVEVAAVELVGAESYIHGLTASGSTVVFRTAGRSAVDLGQRMTLTADTHRFHFFRSDGTRL
jgi:sn-glycerol 3-phosphate transport system ATP-binding protein